MKATIFKTLLQRNFRISLSFADLLKEAFPINEATVFL